MGVLAFLHSTISDLSRHPYTCQSKFVAIKILTGIFSFSDWCWLTHSHHMISSLSSFNHISFSWRYNIGRFGTAHGSHPCWPMPMYLWNMLKIKIRCISCQHWKLWKSHTWTHTHTNTHLHFQFSENKKSEDRASPRSVSPHGNNQLEWQMSSPLTGHRFCALSQSLPLPSVSPVKKLIVVNLYILFLLL